MSCRSVHFVCSLSVMMLLMLLPLNLMSTGRELAKWLRSSSVTEQFSLSQEQEDFELGESPGDLTPSDMARFSVMSNDSGIERDLPPSADLSSLSSLDSASISASWEQSKR